MSSTGPDLAALLGGAGPPGAGAPPGPGAASPAATDSITSHDEGSDLDHLRTCVQALQIYAEGIHDDQELAKVHKAIVLIQSILADHAKNRDAALGTTPAMKHIRRTTRSY